MISKNILLTLGGIMVLFSIGVLSSDICTDTVCCPGKCDNCTMCTGNMIYDEMCCDNVIENSNRTCGTDNAPCKIMKNADSTTTGTNSNDITQTGGILQGAENFYNKIGLINIIFIGIGIIFGFCLLYACTCFDKRKPAIPYEQIIINKFNSNQKK